MTSAKASVVLIEHESKPNVVLAITRRDSATDWGLPGGKIEPGETAEAAAVREVLEETGFHVIVAPYYVDYAEDGVECAVFLGTITGGRLIGSDEGEVKWKHCRHLVTPECSFSSFNARLFLDALGWSA